MVPAVQAASLPVEILPTLSTVFFLFVPRPLQEHSPSPDWITLFSVLRVCARAFARQRSRLIAIKWLLCVMHTALFQEVHTTVNATRYHVTRHPNGESNDVSLSIRS